MVRRRDARRTSVTRMTTPQGIGAILGMVELSLAFDCRFCPSTLVMV